MSNVNGPAVTKVSADKQMSIVVVGPQHPDSLPRSVKVTLEKMGHRVGVADEREMLGTSFARSIKRGSVGRFVRRKLQFIDILAKHFPAYERRIYRRLADCVIAQNPDLVIAHSAWIPPDAIRRIKESTNAKVVLWFPDHPANIGRGYCYKAPYDALFFKDKYLVGRAKTLGRNAHYLPEACMPEWHRCVEPTEEEKEYYGCDVAIAGNLYYYRALILESLLSRYKTKVWGPPIPRWLDSPVRAVHQGKVVTELEKSACFNAAKIVLNTFQGEVEGVNQRFFEIAGCGGFQVCEYRDEIKNFFEIDKEVVTFHTVSELIEKIDYYLAHPEERQKIADAAYARAHREHVFEKRIFKMLEILEIQ